MLSIYEQSSNTRKKEPTAMEPITDFRQSFADASEAVRNQLAIQFKPLVNRIVAQVHKQLKTEWGTLESMGYEGLVIAMNTYDPERSDMNFTQFAAFAILNNIRNCSCIELHTIKLTSYTQDQIRKARDAEEQASDDPESAYDGPVGIGTSTFTTVSISSAINPGSDNDKLNNEVKYGLYESAKFENGDIMELLKYYVDEACNPRDAQCFYRYFGVCGYEEAQVTDMADELGVTSGRISQRIRKVLDYIRSNEILCESLGSLLER